MKLQQLLGESIHNESSDIEKQRLLQTNLLMYIFSEGDLFKKHRFSVGIISDIPNTITDQQLDMLWEKSGLMQDRPGSYWRTTANYTRMPYVGVCTWQQYIIDVRKCMQDDFGDDL